MSLISINSGLVRDLTLHCINTVLLLRVLRICDIIHLYELLI